MSRPGEDELIARHLAPLAGPGGLGLKDDAALLSPRPGEELVLTVDTVVEGVHFLPGDPPDTVAAKALGVNLSDLAAKGAEPVGYLLALSLADGWTEAWLAAFCAGLKAVGHAASCPLLGGDTVRAAGPLSMSVTAIGSVPAGRMVRRTTAQPGDALCVTGTIGDAVLGLALLVESGPPAWARALSADDVAMLVDRYRRPQPRLALAPALLDLAHAAMDVSDGLVGDARKLLAASGVAGTLDLDAVPFSAPVRAALAGSPELRERLVSGGDDYEVLCTLPPDRVPELSARAKAVGLTVTAIGSVEAGSGMRILASGQERTFAESSFQHFGATLTGS